MKCPDLTSASVILSLKVFVTINYRLGALGFLTTYDSTMPGNLGLWDQRMAMQWAKENVAAFGGDPDQVPNI